MRLRSLFAIPFVAALGLSAAEAPPKHPLSVDDIWAVSDVRMRFRGLKPV